jgi:hypothetical protein
LRRVVGRADGRDVPEAGPPIAAPDCFAGSGLTGNAFAVLGVGLDASAQAISDAVDDLSFGPGHDPDALNAARAAPVAGAFREIGVARDDYGDWSTKRGDFTFMVDDGAFRTGALAVGHSLGRLITDTMSGRK